MTLKSAQDLLLNELRDIYDAEKQLVKALAEDGKGCLFGAAAPSYPGASGRNQVARWNAWRTLSIAPRYALLAASAARRCGASSRRPAR